MVLFCATAAAEEPPVEVWGDAPEPDDQLEGKKVVSVDLNVLAVDLITRGAVSLVQNLRQKVMQ